MNLGDRVKFLRILLGYDQKRLGERLGVTQSSVAKLEKAIKPEKFALLDKLIAITGTQESWLLYEKGPAWDPYAFFPVPPLLYLKLDTYKSSLLVLFPAFVKNKDYYFITCPNYHVYCIDLGISNFLSKFQVPCFLFFVTKPKQLSNFLRGLFNKEPSKTFSLSLDPNNPDKFDDFYVSVLANSGLINIKLIDDLSYQLDFYMFPELFINNFVHIELDIFPKIFSQLQKELDRHGLKLVDFIVYTLSRVGPVSDSLVKHLRYHFEKK